MPQHGLAKISKSFFVAPDHRDAMSQLGLTSIDAVFSFNAAENLTKKNLARHRSRLQFDLESPGSVQSTTVFLKRYDHPPVLDQLKNWLTARGRKTCARLEVTAAMELAAEGIAAPRLVSYGEQWGALFEKRSFLVTEKIPNADAIERRLPGYFEGPPTRANLRLRRGFIARLAKFIKRFHQTHYRHRDLYFSHIFCDDEGRFFLIDLARAFKPAVLDQRFRVKDLAQVYYSAPARHFSKTDRLRFYVAYAGWRKLTAEDKAVIRRVIRKAERMARHAKRRGWEVPFAEQTD
ncbi:MAG: lipopolysaccharide kinase InaA family protein [Sedimentisphaerales bacterium]|jgi:heptose I phosphotransferase